MSENTEVIELTDEIEVVGPGTMLREARLALGLSQQVVAQRLNLRSHQIEQIEAENFCGDMPPTFTRGYLRNYAKLVNVCEQDVLAAYDHLGVAAAHASKMQSFSKQTFKETENRILMGLTYVILIGLVAMSGIWWYQQDSASSSESAVSASDKPAIESAVNESAGIESSAYNSEASETPTQGLAQTQNSVVMNSEQSNTLADKTELDVSASNNEELEPELNTSAQNTNKPSLAIESADAEAGEQTSAENTSANQVEETPVTTLESNIQTANERVILNENEFLDSEETEIFAVEPVPVSFYFRGDCWVNIFDATGERIAWGVKKADYTMNIKGVPPFKVTLGKPDLVSISFDGIPVDISQFGAGQIAKFELPLEE